MTVSQPTPRARSRSRSGSKARSTIRAAFLLANVAIIGVFVHQTMATSISTTSRGGLGEADGAVPDGVTVFDDKVPGVVNLDPDLLGALRRAATAAAKEGIVFYVNSGWRSPAYQAELLRQAVDKYGSSEEAARWVATPENSPHVQGQAIDIGRSEATAWLAEHGARYGLCQIYDNEPWHYELRPEAVQHGCPPRYADPTHDPRMQR